MKVLILLAALLAFSGNAYAATRDYIFHWTMPTMTVDGDLLDQDGDGNPELLNGVNLYMPDGTQVYNGTDNQETTTTLRLNLPFGENCFTATAHGTGGESDNTLPVCKTIVPGRPNPPTEYQF